MSSPLAGLARPFRRTFSRAALAVAMAVSLLGAPAAATPVEAAGAGWFDGGIQESVITNCASIIFGNPYLEYGMGTYVGYDANPDTSTPQAGQTYYLHVVMSGLGNTCSGQYAVPYLVLPVNTQLAITGGTPVKCYTGLGQDTVNCPQTLPYNASLGYLIKPTSQAMWPLPQGASWEFQVPVVSSTTLTSSIFGAHVVVADGNANPTLVPTQNVFVFSGTGSPQPVIQYPSPNTDTITRTSAISYANIYTGGLAGTTHYQIGATSSYGLIDDTFHLTAGPANWSLYDDWLPLVLTPDTLYHFRMWFDPDAIAGTSDAVYGTDQTFRTAGAVTHFSVSAPASVSGGTPISVTVTAKDATETTVTGYRGTISFSSSDGSAAVPANHVFTAGESGVATVSGVAFSTAGTQTITAQDTARAGVNGKATVSVTSSAVKPTAAIGAQPVWRASTSVPLTWSGTGASFDVLYKRAAYNGTYGNLSLWKNGTTAKSATFTGAPGSTYCFQVRSTAANGISSDLTAPACTAVPLDERSMTRSGTWTAGTGSAYYKSTYLRTTAQGARLTRTGVQARRIAIVATTCATCGKVSVYRGSTLLKTISLYSATTKNKRVISVIAFGSVTSGTISIKVVTSGKKVLIDGLVISRN